MKAIARTIPRLVSLFVVALSATVPLHNAAALTATVNGVEWSYAIHANAGVNEVEIEQASPARGAITIPPTLGGYPVTAIKVLAFSDCGEITSVTIPDSVRNIGWYAFDGCTNLTSVKIGKGVTTIGNFGFGGCWNLKSVTIPDSVTCIEFLAFAGCSGLTSMKIGNGVTDMGDQVFLGCSSLTSLTIPDSMVNIGSNAFENCSSLKTLYFPKRFKGNTAHMGIPSSCKAVFIPVSKYKVAFDANGGRLPKGKKMAAQKMTYDKTAKLRKNVFRCSGSVFIGWATSKANAQKGKIAFRNAQSVMNLTNKGGTVKLYAVWAKKTYKVAFYANGGKGTMKVQSLTYGKATKLRANKFTKKNRTFGGWAKSKARAEKGEVTYRDQQAVKNLVTTGKTVKLYAVWKKK